MQNLNIALAGKPNSGKSSLFNHLTGLRQKIGNFPGVTVDKRVGTCRLPNDVVANIVDLPGVYSLYPRSMDEKIVANVLLNEQNHSFPDLVVVVADATNLQNSLLLLTQLIDLQLPVVLALNMMDMVVKSGWHIDTDALSLKLSVPVVPISARKATGINTLKKTLACALPQRPSNTIYSIEQHIAPVVAAVKKHFTLPCDYMALQYLQQAKNLDFLTAADRQHLEQTITQSGFDVDTMQGQETLFRYRFIQNTLDDVVQQDTTNVSKAPSYRIDKLLTHRIWGHLIFLGIMLLMFQSIFAWAQFPMEWIDSAIAQATYFLGHHLPAGTLTDLITQGVLPGVGGVIIFIPQIAILFFYIAILEQTGYMSRVVFLMDNTMRKFGMNGRSVVPLISGWACAIPAIMATRTIENWKERLTTLFTIPLMSCSARLPVYTILVALLVSGDQRIGFFDARGLILFGFYLLGTLAALVSAWVMKKILVDQGSNLLLMELPPYRTPSWSHVGIVVIEKVKIFVWNAGKIILAISMILWLLASYGPPGQMAKAELRVAAELQQGRIHKKDVETRLQTYRLEYSYAGMLGKAIEPVITPLGYDWKIGIALLSSLAAREVFVGTVAILYSVGDEQTATIKNRLQREKNPNTGTPRFDYATVLSLLIFYTFAMQCISTLAVVKRETKTWKWPFIQLVYMTTLAYLSALVVYQAVA